MSQSVSTGRLVAVSDLHVGFPDNRRELLKLRAQSPDDWLIVAGDVAEKFEDIEWALSVLADRFAKVFWSPGNHELWITPSDPVQLAGAARYAALVAMCRSLGVITPEDRFEIWSDATGDVVVAPLFLLYDYTFLPPLAATEAEGWAQAEAANVICTDEYLLKTDPFPSVREWCAHRLEVTRQRLEARPDGLPTVLINHYPLVQTPTSVLRYPEFAMWCGTAGTRDWHERFRAVAMVYGHLHIPRVTTHGSTVFHEVSLGYPREWQARPTPPAIPRQILPPAPTVSA